MSDADPPELAGVTTLLAAVLYKRALLLVRYPVNTLASVLGIYLFFAVIFFGGQAAVAGVSGGVGALGDTFDALIVGWFVFTMSTVAYFGLAQRITEESQWGTLEQLYMSPYGFGAVMGATVIALLAESLLWGGSVLGLMLVTTDQTLSLDVLTVVPVTVFTLLSVVGVGFVFAGGALVYKRIGNVTQLAQFALIGLIAAPATDIAGLRYLPIVQGSAMLQIAMREGVRLWAFPTAELAVLGATGVGYCLLGYGTFRLAARRARREGLMGQY